METKTYIIGDSADKDNILDLCSQLSNKGVEADAIFLTEDTTASEEVCSVPVALLWISSKAGIQLFNIAQERNKRNLTTLNFFAEPVALNDSERRAVGRNQSVFAEVNPDEFVEDLIGLIGQKKLSPSQKANVNQLIDSNTLETAKVKTSGNATNIEEEQSTRNSDHELALEDEQEENQALNNKRALRMPWVWYLIAILYNVCIISRILKATTDQPVWYLVLNAVYFILAYKIVRSTIAAIKINKWCYAYIPFSLCGMVWNLRVGIECLRIFINSL